MKKLTLGEWASLGEVVASVAVVASLVFVGQSIERNSSEVRAAHLNDIFDATREIELAVAADAEWSRIVEQGRSGASLSPVEQYRYDAYVVSTIDVWDQVMERRLDELIAQATIEPWDRYFVQWLQRHVTETDWARIGWQWEGELTEKIEANLRSQLIGTP